MMTIFQIPFRHSATGIKDAKGSSLATGLVWASVVGVLAFIVVYPIAKLVIFSFTARTGLTFDNYFYAFGRAKRLFGEGYSAHLLYRRISPPLRGSCWPVPMPAGSIVPGCF